MTDIEKKIDHVRLMASGEIMTCLGPADRAGLRQVLEELNRLKIALACAKTTIDSLLARQDRK